MAVGDGILAGQAWDGCVESDVANHCRAAIVSGTPLRPVYGRCGAGELPLPCGDESNC